MSSPRFARWRPVSGGCSGGAQPGARALMKVILLRYPAARSWGIYSCRPTALGNLSKHAKGEALDVGCTIPTGARIVRDLLDLGPWTLGISAIIHNRRIYSARSPRGRPYGGHPHHDHVHIEMTRKASRRLSLARARRVLLG